WTRRVKEILVAELGSEAVVDVPASLGVEDFAYIAERVPGLCLDVGIVGDQFTTGLHSPGLIVDERGLKAGAAAFTAVALRS
ncbi:MAG: amidohydrolase, partial [Thermaerobacter sp.]|nr:amidohydrolase [Thermaerobacter sp.]